MKVLLLCNKSPWPPREGGPIAMYAMIRGLLMAGFEVKVLALNTNKYSVELTEIPEAFLKQTGLELVKVDLSFRPIDAFLNLFTGKSYHIQRFRSPQFAEALTSILQTETFDVVQFESVFLTSYISLIRKYSNARLVLRAHNIEHLIWHRLAGKNPLPLHRRYLHYLATTLQNYELSVMHKVDGIAAITANDAERFRQLGCAGLVGTIPFGVTLPQAELQGMGGSPNTLFHIGSMNWLPNQEGFRWFLKECWPLIHVKYPEVKLVLAGRGMPRWMLNLRISGVEIVGEVDDATQFMAENGIMVVPLFSGSGVRVKIVEAMALAKTVITTTIGAEGIQCEHQKNILLANTPAEFLQAIIACFSEPGLTERIGREAQQAVRDHHLLEQVSQKTSQFYQQLLQNEPI